MRRVFTAVVLIFFISGTSFSQVIIREKVGIKPEVKEIENLSSILYTDSGIFLIMPKAGILALHYILLNHFDRQIPSYSSLNAYLLSVDSVKTDSIIKRFSDCYSGTDSFLSYCPPYAVNRFNINCIGDPIYYDFCEVKEGDTLKFTYLSDIVTTGEPFEYGIYDINGGNTYWDIKFGNFDGCLQRFDNLLYINIYIKEKKEEIYASVLPDVLNPNDTATITIKKKLTDGTLADYPEDQAFEVGMLEGCALGNITANNSSGTYLYNVHQPIKFIADSSRNSGIVKLRVGLLENMGTLSKINKARLDISKPKEIKKIEEQINNPDISGSNKKQMVKKLNKILLNENIESNFCFTENFQSEIFTDAKLEIKKENEVAILLGETKYFQAKYDSTNKLVIDEVKPGSDGLPKLNGGLASDVWGNNPVSLDTGKNYGKRMGVYWETEKPVWDGKTNKGNLEKGLIRLVGRYWAKDSTYIVKLKAKKNMEDSASIDIKVIKPSVLLSKGQSPTYSKSRDVFNKEYSVDSLCIYWGGLYGIPPQLIKGHIEKEAPPKNFPSYTGFAPSYRYEPYTTQFNYGVKNLINNNNSFVVTNYAMGVSGAAKVPTETEHYNVLYIHYPQSPKTVWEFINENSQLTNPDNPSTFGYRYKGTPPDERKKGQLHSSSYKIINKKYEQKLVIADSLVRNKYKVRDPDELTLAQQIEVNDSARVQLVKFLRYEWKGNLDTIVAQTRIAASYGLLQNLYTTALGEGFKDTLTNNPEKLNEPEGFKYNIYHYTSLFKRNSFNLNETNNYASSFKLYNNRGELIYKAGLGFEEAFRTIVFLWNTLSSYNKKVFEYMNNFLPRE